MRNIFVIIFVLLSIICYAQNKCIQYIKSTCFVEKNTAFYFNSNIIKSIDSETDIYLVWIKSTPFKDEKFKIIRDIHRLYKSNKLKSNFINSFYYTVQLYIVDIYSYRYKVASEKVYYDIRSNELMSEDIDADGCDWNYCRDGNKMYGLLSQIKGYINKSKL